MSDLVSRLRGVYTIPVNDGAGPLDGKNTVTRTFDKLPPIMGEAATHIEALERENAVLYHERNTARARADRLVAVLVGIHNLLLAPDVKLPDGRVMVFDPQEKALYWECYRELGNRIRAIPDEITASVPQSPACTCHPDDNPPRPCPQKFALSDCRAEAALDSMTRNAEELGLYDEPQAGGSSAGGGPAKLREDVPFLTHRCASCGARIRTYGPSDMLDRKRMCDTCTAETWPEETSHRAGTSKGD